MNSEKIGRLKVVYHPEDQDTADLIEGACEKALELAKSVWGLTAPEHCAIYVVTSWWESVFRPAPWPWRIVFAANIPIWIWRVRRTWSYAAGWTQRYGRRVAIGIKPPRLLEISDRSIGSQIFMEEKDVHVKIQQVTCHELVHACSAHLKLPAWLNEGLAMLTVDRFMNKPSVKLRSLDLLRNYVPKSAPPTYRKLSRMSKDAIAYHTVRGYWIVRFLEETQPGFLPALLSRKRNARQIERELSAVLAMEPKLLWQKIDDLLIDHFNLQEIHLPASN